MIFITHFIVFLHHNFFTKYWGRKTQVRILRFGNHYVNFEFLIFFCNGRDKIKCMESIVDVYCR